jgi:hypothetical protein
MGVHQACQVEARFRRGISGYRAHVMRLEEGARIGCALRLLLKRPDVAHRVAWEATLVLVHFAHVCGNHVDGNAVGQERMGHGRATVIGKLAEVQLHFGDARLVACLVEAAGVVEVAAPAE